MSSIQALLDEWRSLYCEWTLAELELRAVRERQPGTRQEVALEARVRELQETCRSRLDQTSKALASSGSSTKARPAGAQHERPQARTEFARSQQPSSH